MNEFGIDTIDPVNAGVVSDSAFGIFRQGWFGYTDMGTNAYKTRTSWALYDTSFQPNVQAFQSAGKPAGVYFFSHAWDVASAKHEVDVTIQRCEQLGISPDWPLFLDWEDNGGAAGSYQALINIGITPTQALLRQIFTAWCERCIERGYRAGFYTNQWIAATYLGTSFIDTLRNAGYWYWDAEWGASSPWYDCDIWQYLNDQPLHGVNVDYNYVRDDRVWGSQIPLWLKIYIAKRGENSGKCTILL